MRSLLALVEFLIKTTSILVSACHHIDCCMLGSAGRPFVGERVVSKYWESRKSCLGHMSRPQIRASQLKENQRQK